MRPQCYAYVGRETRSNAELPDLTSQLLTEQHRRSPEKRCHFGAVSNAVLKHLADFWNISHGSLHSGPSELLPLLLNYEDVHMLGIKLFFRLWTESMATIGDFNRIDSLVGTQLALTLKTGSTRKWKDVEQ